VSGVYIYICVYIFVYTLQCLDASCVMPLAITPVVPVTAAKCPGYVHIYIHMYVNIFVYVYIHWSAWMPRV